MSVETVAVDSPAERALNLLLDHAAKFQVESYSGKDKALQLNVNLPTQDPAEARFALNYLDAFGFLVKALANWRDISLGDITDAVMSFQGWFGLKRSGNLCARTIKAMQWPRCGVPDIVREHHPYVKVRAWAKARLPAWKKRNLKYVIADYVSGIGKAAQQEIIHNAFLSWTQHGQLDVEVSRSNEADIVISTGEGPRSNFDGPGGTLAWAYLPEGDDRQLLMKFDLGETWSASPEQRGILLPNVGAHEIGHLLGLDHSRSASALMAPTYNQRIGTPQDNDDIPRFVARYGKRDQPTPPSGSAIVRIETEGKVELFIGGRKVS